MTATSIQYVLKILSKYLFSLLLFALTITLAANEAKTTTLSIHPKLTFKHITNTNTVAERSSYFQSEIDQKGNLWAGTGSGLFRFNGRDFQVFKKFSEAYLDDAIGSLSLVDDGVILIGTSTGLVRFDISKEQFTDLSFNVGNLYNLPFDERATSFLREKNKRTVLVGQENHLLRYNIDSGLFSEIKINGLAALVKLGEISAKKIVFSAIHTDNGRKLWIGTYTNGFFSYNLETKELELIDQLDDGSRVNLTRVKSIIPSPTNPNNLLLATAEGAFSFNQESKIISRFPISKPIKEPVNKIVVAKNGDIWIASKHVYQFNKKGLVKYDKEKDFKIKKNSTSANNIFVDSQGSIFAFYGGVGVYRASPFTSKAQLLNDFPIDSLEVWALKVDSSNRAWVGFQKGVFYGNVNGPVFKYKEAFREDGSSFDDVYELHSGISGQFWVAETTTLTRISRNGDAKTYDLQEVTNKLGKIRNLVQDKNGNVWLKFRNSEGLELFNPSTGTVSNIKALNVLGLNAYATNLFVSPERDRIFFTTTSLLGFIDVDKQTLITEQDTIYQKYWRDNLETHEDRNNYYYTSFKSGDSKRVYMAHSRNGMTVFSWECNCFKYEEFPFDKRIEIITSFDNNLFWMLDNSRNLIMWDKEKGSLRELGVKEGIPESGLYGAVGISLADNTALMGSNSGPVLFSLDQMAINPYKPKSHLDKLYINNKEEAVANDSLLNKNLAYIESLQLTHDQNNFAISFTSSISEDQDKIGYEYRLIGFNNEWFNTNSDSPIATYTNINHGKYVFEVKSSNNDGLWGEPRSLNIIITPSLWNTNLAYFLYILSFMFGVYFFIIFRTKSINKKNIHLEETVREKTRKYEEQLIRNEGLLKFKENFIFNFSHELKSMLQLQGLSIESLSDNYPEVCQRLEKSNKKVTRIVYQLLDLARMKGHSNTQKTFFDVGSLLRLTIPLFQTLAEASNITINTDISNEPMIIMGEPASVERIFTNLISNAVKYNRIGGSINIKAFTKGLNINIVISDNGYGIPGDIIPEPFEYAGFSGPNTSKPNKGQISHGIGLEFVNEAAKQNSVKVFINSKAGLGTSFSLLFKAFNNAQMDSIAGVSVDPNEHIISEYGEKSDSEKLELIRSNLSHEQSRYTVLIIDDNLDLLYSLASQLNIHFNLLIAGGGDEGIDLALKHCPDLILTDLNMPGVDGFDVIKTIKNNATLSYIPVLLLTAVSSKDVQIKGLKIGADDVIGKPAKSSVIVQKIINRLNANKQLMEGLFSKMSINIDERTPKSHQTPTTQQAEENDSVEWITKLNSYIENNMMNKENLLAPSVAKHMDCRARFLSSKVIKYTKCTSIRIYIRDYRLRLANKELHKDGYIKIEAVAFEHGFTPEIFSSEYKKLFKVSPKEALAGKNH